MTVHVFGEPDYRDMKSDERECSWPDDGEGIVYHPDSERTHLGDHLCRECGKATGVWQ